MEKLLIVDDDPLMRRLLRHYLHEDYDVCEADNGDDAVRIANDFHPDLVIMNVDMPGIDGYETCRRLKALPSELAPIVSILSSHSDVEELRKAFAAGADDYMLKPIDRHELASRLRLQIKLRAALGAMDSLQRTENSRQKLSKDLEHDVAALQDTTASMLAKLAETRDGDTGAHLFRMRDYAIVLAQSLRRNANFTQKIDDEFLANLRRACPLHDIGKIAVPDAILHKSGLLNAEEIQTMRRHTIVGAAILSEGADQLRDGAHLVMAAEIARSHHECWDGSGYPDRLRGLEIPPAARIVAVADVYDALTSARPYKEAWSSSKAFRYIVEESGKHFDPEVVEAFERCYDDFVHLQLHSEVDHVEDSCDCANEPMPYYSASRMSDLAQQAEVGTLG